MPSFTGWRGTSETPATGMPAAAEASARTSASRQSSRRFARSTKTARSLRWSGAACTLGPLYHPTHRPKVSPFSASASASAPAAREARVKEPNTSPFTEPSGSGPDDGATVDALALGTPIGRFVVLGPLGRGGMGVVAL